MSVCSQSLPEPQWAGLETPLGPCWLWWQGQELSFCGFGSEATVWRQAAAQLDRLPAQCPAAVACPLPAALWEEWPAPSELPFTLCLHGSDFQRKVWQGLLEIPLGLTWTYAELARRIGCGASHARAVGTAVAQNPLAWFVPCHRVVPASGGYGDYRWGAQTKAEMLNREQFVF